MGEQRSGREGGWEMKGVMVVVVGGVTWEPVTGRESIAWLALES